MRHPQVQAEMNFANALPQTEADFFDEQGLMKEYRPPVQQQQQQTGGMFALRKIPIASLTPSSVSDPVPDPGSNPYSRFPIPRYFRSRK